MSPHSMCVHYASLELLRASLVAQLIKESAFNAGDLDLISSWKDPLEKGMTESHSSILSWRIPWTERPGGLQSTGSQESDTT